MRLKTSSASELVLNKIWASTKMQYTDLARLAFAVSLIKWWKNIDKNFDDIMWKELIDTSFKHIEFYRALLSSLYQKNLTDEEFYSNNSYLKLHIDRWCKYLDEIWTEVWWDKNEFLIKIAQLKSTIAAEDVVNEDNEIDKELSGVKLNVKLWETKQWKPVILELNNEQKYWNSHLALMWKPWQWKTQILLNILMQIRELSNFDTNFIFFDYKHDSWIHNTGFIERAKVKKIDLSQEALPINPFVLENYEWKGFNMSIEEKVETFSSASKWWFWEVQKTTLSKLIKECYEDRQWSDIPYPDFKELYSKAIENWIKEDTLFSTLRKLSEYWLFHENSDENTLIRKLYKESLVIDFSQLTALKELVAFLTIESLYHEMKTLDDAPIENWFRKIRTILVIDEAHNYLWCKNPFLERIIREWRSKWFVVFFASQSPSDYDQKFFDYNEFLWFSLILWCWSVQKTSMQKMISCSDNDIKVLVQEVWNLSPFEMIMKDRESQKWYTKVVCDPYYLVYG